MSTSKARSATLSAEPVGGARPQAGDKLQTWEAVLAYGSLLLAFALAVRGISYSLFMDEAGTYWVIQGGIKNLFSRAWEWPGASAVYDLAAWASHFLAPLIGLEPALRLPSVIATVAAALLIYQLGLLLADRRTGLLSVIAFLCIFEVSFAAIDGRPYALGVALLAASMLYFLKFLDSPRRLYAMLYILASVLLVYTHYLLALGLVAQLIPGWRNRRRLAPVWLAIGALCLPLSGHLLDLYHARLTHAFAPAPELSALLRAVAPPALVAAVFLTAILADRPAVQSLRIPRLFLLVWAFFPPAFLFLVSTFTDTSLFHPRYLLGAAPALALLAGYSLSRMAPVGVASVVLLLAHAITFWSISPYHALEDWRGAMDAVNAQAAPEDPVLVASGFVEATPDEINRRDVLFSPQLAYPISHMFRLPHTPSRSALPADLNGVKRLFLVGSYDPQRQYVYLLGERLPGYRAQQIGSFGEVFVTRFDK
jgi:hypothetical protein